MGFGGTRLVLFSVTPAPVGDSGELGDATSDPKYEIRLEGGDCGERGVSILLGTGGALAPGTGGGAPRVGRSGPLPPSVISSSDTEPALGDCSAGGGGGTGRAGSVSSCVTYPASRGNTLSRLCMTGRSPGIVGGADRSVTGGGGGTGRSSMLLVLV